LLAPRLFGPPALFLAPGLLLAAAGIRLGRRKAVSGRQLDFETGDLVPHRIATVALRDRKQLAQAAARVRGLGFEGLGLVYGLGLVEGLRLAGLIWAGGFFVHPRIIL
jgi:hypothetical protein